MPGAWVSAPSLLELFYTLALFCHNGIFVGVRLDVTINKPYQ